MAAAVQSCRNPSCNKLSKKEIPCLPCNKEFYCSETCKEHDTDIYRMMCSSMKREANFLPCKEVEMSFNALLGLALKYLTTESAISILPYALSFLEFQCGTPVVGQTVRERDGQLTKDSCIGRSCL